jgi:hypothetical protein
MKIDIFSGSLSFSDGLIKANQSRQEFLQSTIGRRSTSDLVNLPWRHYRIRPEESIAGNVLFEGDRLHQVFVLMMTPTEESDEWSMANEIKRKAVHDAWLRKELGKPPYEYRWGQVSSELDAKGVVSEIIVTYAK